MHTLSFLEGDTGNTAAVAVPPCIYLVDDEPSVCKAMARLLRTADYEVVEFHSAEHFLAGHDPHAHGCVILDMAMPGLDGLAAQEALVAVGNEMPIIFLTGQADVPMCARAMKSGALDFLTKPADEAVLFAAVEHALEVDARLRGQRALRELTRSRFATLTPREREVLMQVITGRLNKQIAGDLGTAEKTIKVHRARGMEKMRVRSVAELVRLIEQAQLDNRHPAR